MLSLLHVGFATPNICTKHTKQLLFVLPQHVTKAFFVCVCGCLCFKCFWVFLPCARLGGNLSGITHLPTNKTLPFTQLPTLGDAADNP